MEYIVACYKRVNIIICLVMVFFETVDTLNIVVFGQKRSGCQGWERTSIVCQKPVSENEFFKVPFETVPFSTPWSTLTNRTCLYPLKYSYKPYLSTPIEILLQTVSVYSPWSSLTNRTCLLSTPLGVPLQTVPVYSPWSTLTNRTCIHPLKYSYKPYLSTPIEVLLQTVPVSTPWSTLTNRTCFCPLKYSYKPYLSTPLEVLLQTIPA